MIGLFSKYIFPGNLKLYFSKRKPIIYSGNQSDWFRFPGATFPWKSLGILSELITREIKNTVREGFRFPGATFPGKALGVPDGIPMVKYKGLNARGQSRAVTQVRRRLSSKRNADAAFGLPPAAPQPPARAAAPAASVAAVQARPQISAHRSFQTGQRRQLLP